MTYFSYAFHSSVIYARYSAVQILVVAHFTIYLYSLPVDFKE